MNQLEHRLNYPFGDALPAPGSSIEVSPGVRWLRMGLPFALNHINLWALADEDAQGPGWAIVDTGTQTPDQFARMQSATTGLPEHMCKFNMEKNQFVLANMDKILDSLTRGLDLEILSRGYGVEARGVPVTDGIDEASPTHVHDHAVTGITVV